jgi:hypothetical protein
MCCEGIKVCCEGIKRGKGKKIPAGGHANDLIDRSRFRRRGESELFSALFFVFDDDQFDDLISLYRKEIVQVSGIGRL